MRQVEKIKLYLADIRQLEGKEEQCMELLTQQRREKASAITQPKPRLHSIAAGLLLRKVLGMNGEDKLSIGPYGKPEMISGQAVSLAHGGNYAVLALGKGRVGVDIEPVPELIPRLPSFVFTEKELEWLESHPGPVDFVLLWTRLESALKADGRGFEGCEREFCVLDGGPWFISSLEYDGHVLSCAADMEFEPEMEMIPAEELIQ